MVGWGGMGHPQKAGFAVCLGLVSTAVALGECFVQPGGCWVGFGSGACYWLGCRLGLRVCLGI